MPKVTHKSSKFLLGKETSEKKTSKEFETKMNSVSNSDMNLELHQDLINKSLDPYSKQGFFKKWCSSTFIKRQRNLRVAGITASFLLFIISAFTIFPIVHNATKAEALTGTATASDTILEITSTLDSANLDLLVKDSSGTFASSSDNELAKFDIVTNNYTGYTLSIAGSDDTKKLVNAAGNALNSIEYPTGADAFSTLGTYNGKWGYKPNQYYDTANNAVITNTDFLPSPTTESTLTLDKTNTATTKKQGAESDELDCKNYDCKEYTIALGARANYDTPNGVYSNTFVLTVVGNDVTYTIEYDRGNASDTETITGLPETQSSSTSETTITLSNGIPTRGGYKFIGWCDGTVSTDENNLDSCLGADGTGTGTVYNPNGDGTNLTYGIDQTTTNVVTLHAMWRGQSMQTWTGCSGLSSGETITLTDARDNQDYDIVKIGDYCVMKSNLAITGTIKAQESNFTGNDIVADYNDYGWFTSSYIGSKVLYKDPATNIVYYNYCMASAGTVCAAVNTSTSVDICPSSWKMPTNAVWTSIAGTSGAAGLFSATLGGYYTNAAAATDTANGYYWSQTTYNANYPYTLRANATTMTPLNNSATNYRYYGQSIRCVYTPATMEVTAGEGIESVSINSGTAGTSATYEGKIEDNITLTITPKAGYGPAYTWTTTAGGLATSTTNVETKSFTLTGDIAITVSATKGVAVIIKTNTGVSNVSLNSSSCNTAAGCYVTGLNPGSSYDLAATVATGYTWSTWSTTAGSVASASSASTRFTLPSSGSGTVATITPSATSNKYNITVKTVTGISSVKIGDNTCTSTSGCTYSLDYGKGYSLVATKSSGYDFSSWSNSANIGTIANASAASTTFTVGLGATTITPSVKSCTQTISGTMQTYTTAVSSLCSDASGTLTDNRDNQTYTVARYGSLIWMTRNLAIGCNGSGANYGSGRTTRSLTSSNSNVSSTWSTSSALSLDKTDNTANCTTSTTSDCNSYTTARMKCDSTYGAWYNYAAATAGTIYGDSNSTEAQYSVCPSGWRLFTSSERQTSADFKNRFIPVYGGYYNNGVVYNASGLGYWWSSTAGNSNNRSALYYVTGSLSSSGDGRYRGGYVRCVRS